MVGLKDGTQRWVSLPWKLPKSSGSLARREAVPTLPTQRSRGPHPPPLVEGPADQRPRGRAGEVGRVSSFLPGDREPREGLQPRRPWPLPQNMPGEP